jgi:hypothetical protein
MSEVDAKVCRKCGAKFSGRACGACSLARYQRWYAENADAAKEAARRCYQANKTEAIEKQRTRRQAEPEAYRRSQRAWRAANPDAQRRWTLRPYGLTLEDFLAILAAQDGACAICRRTPAPGTNLSVDHDHETNAVRGLLCVACNTRVAAFEHPLTSATRSYIKKHGGEA